MIPLASDLLPCPDQMRREGHLKSASPPDRLSSSGRTAILGTISRKCPAALTAPVDKIIACDRSARYDYMFLGTDTKRVLTDFPFIIDATNTLGRAPWAFPN